MTMNGSASRPERDISQTCAFREQDFVEFYHHMAPRLMRYLLFRGLAPISAQDVVQEVMVKLLHRWEQVENREAWAFRVAANEASHLYQQNMRNREVLLPADEHMDALTHDPIAQTAETIDMRAVLRNLPLRQQEVVLLHYMEDLPVTQIAEIMSISVRGVHRHLAAARKNLRKQLQITPGTHSQPPTSS